jgi:hypothetical protein
MSEAAAVGARVALRELASRYALAVDDRSLDTLVDLFAPDARFAAANGSFAAEGSAEIRAEYRRQLNGLGPTFHVVHDQIVDLEANDGTMASGLVTGHAEVWREGRLYRVAMRYRDRYVRLDGTWHFAERSLGFLYYVAAEDYAGLPATSDRFRLPGAAGVADWPEKGRDWQTFYRSR